MNWEAISAISTFVATIVIVVTGIFAILQLREMRHSRRLELFIELFDYLSSPEARQNRKFVYTSLPTDPSQLTDQHFFKIDEVLSSLDRVWILIEQKQLEAKFIIDSYGEMFLRLWTILYPIVLYERKRRGQYYRMRAEALVEATRKRFRKQNRSVDYQVYKSTEHKVQEQQEINSRVKRATKR
jgi:hypothetical protein